MYKILLCLQFATFTLVNTIFASGPNEKSLDGRPGYLRTAVMWPVLLEGNATISRPADKPDWPGTIIREIRNC
jgi:hypothetical protein